MDAVTLRDGLLQLILLIISIGLHEFGHAWMADRRGDPLPRLQGRVTLNPFAHADPIGTIALPAIMIFLSPGFGLIGWGKPVQISLPNPRTRRMDDIYITLAGPAMNLVLCFIFAPRSKQQVWCSEVCQRPRASARCSPAVVIVEH